MSRGVIGGTAYANAAGWNALKTRRRGPASGRKTLGDRPADGFDFLVRVPRDPRRVRAHTCIRRAASRRVSSPVM